MDGFLSVSATGEELSGENPSDHSVVFHLRSFVIGYKVSEYNGRNLKVLKMEHITRSKYFGTKCL